MNPSEGTVPISAPALLAVIVAQHKPDSRLYRMPDQMQPLPWCKAVRRAKELQSGTVSVHASVPHLPGVGAGHRKEEGSETL